MTKICRTCSVEHQIKRVKRWHAVGFCPICLEYHVLFLVDENTAGNKAVIRANGLIALRDIDGSGE